MCVTMFLLGVHLRKNLRDLVSIDDTDPSNCARKFWAWLHRQKWRKMLPWPKENLSIAYCISVFGLVCVCVWEVIWPFIRIDVLLTDPLRKQPEFVGKWHMFLPSDVFLGKKAVFSLSCCFLRIAKTSKASLHVSIWRRVVPKEISWTTWGYLVMEF